MVAPEALGSIVVQTSKVALADPSMYEIGHTGRRGELLGAPFGRELLDRDKVYPANG
jgi:hypothetical protein